MCTKELRPLLLLLLLYSVLVISTALEHTSTSTAEIPYPQIVVSQKSSLSQVTQEVSRNGEKFTIPLNFKELHFVCRSNYPTRWMLVPSPQRNRDGSNLKEWSITKTRHVGNISDESSYKFSSRLSMLFFTNMPNRALNQYVACRHVATKHELINTNLTLSSSTLDLFGEFTNGRKLVRAGQAGGTRYGGNRKCHLRLHLDVQRKQVACESVDRGPSTTAVKPPIVIECLNPDECETEVEAEKCPTKSVEPSCNLETCERVAPSSGVIVCEGLTTETSGETSVSSLAQIIYFTLDEPPQMFLDRTEIATDKVLQIKADVTEMLYVNDSVNFRCRASMPCFTRGIEWAVESSDGQMSYLGSGIESDGPAKHIYDSAKKIQFNSAGLATVYCLGPIWNSYEWKNTTYSVNVQNVTSAIISGEPVLMVTINEGSNNSLKCEASGRPTPKLTWKKDEIEVEKGVRTNQNESSIWSELTLDLNLLELSEDTEIKYICEVENAGGIRVRREYYVILDHTGHVHITKSTKIALAVGIPVLVLVLVGIIVYFVLKTRYQARNIQRLSEDEILEFNNGDPHSQNNALFYPYNTDYEISRRKFHIESKILGKGQFGLVVKGKIGRAPVAIKTVKKTADIAYLKALLSELKIMCYVGKHDNIVNLIGASTEDIQKREVYIICEYCSNGNLLQYVQNSRQVFVDHLTHERLESARQSTVDYQNASVKKLSSKDLLRWSYEIACGMEFLSRKNVIHGDLAARNILLSEDLTAKVGDFGLSKQLFEYSIYVQKLECPLPLKWMAIESLRDLEFSIQSDVWSYGVTLWEMYTLGQVPYPGIQWNTSSYQLLLEGYRMQKPQFASDALYSIILRCWEESPSARPSFSDLKHAFDEQMMLNKIRPSKKYYNS